MTAGRVLVTLLVSAGAALIGAERTTAQAPARGAGAQAPAKGAAAPAARGAGGGRQVYGNLAQIMRAIPFPNSNILFDVQTQDPGARKQVTSGDDSTVTAR